MEWKEPEVGTEAIVAHFPDGHVSTYTELWNLGKPDMLAHYSLYDELVKQHGIPKLYQK